MKNDEHGGQVDPDVQQRVRMTVLEGRVAKVERLLLQLSSLAESILVLEGAGRSKLPAPA